MLCDHESNFKILCKKVLHVEISINLIMEILIRDTIETKRSCHGYISLRRGDFNGDMKIFPRVFFYGDIFGDMGISLWRF